MAAGADLTLVGKDVVRLILGSQWSESARIFELFGPGIGAMLLCSTIGWIHLSIGKPGRWLRWTLFQLSVTACLFLLALQWGAGGNCRSVERVLLESFDSWLLVCWPAHRVWCPIFDCRYLAVRGRSARSEPGDYCNHPRYAFLGHPFEPWHRTELNSHHFNTVCHFLFGDCHSFASELGTASPTRHSSA